MATAKTIRSRMADDTERPRAEGQCLGARSGNHHGHLRPKGTRQRPGPLERPRMSKVDMTEEVR